MTPEYMQLHLARLAAEFQVDIAEALHLEGAALESWIYEAEDDLFKRLCADLADSKSR